MKARAESFRHEGCVGVKHIVKHVVARLNDARRWLGGADEGSGTISGVALIAVASIMLGAIAMAANLLFCAHRAQNTADMVAVAVATSLRDGAVDPCSSASRTAAANETLLPSGAIEGEDALVSVRSATQLPFAPWVERQSRAGPIACG